MSRKCYLKCDEGLHDPILLSENEETLVGRSPVTKIKNTRCSKKQIKLSVNTSQLEVTVTQMGENPSAVHGRFLRKNETWTLKHGDTIELVHGMLRYSIEFDPPPSPKVHTLDLRTSVTPDKNDRVEPELSQGCSLPKRQKLLDNATPSVLESKWEMIDNGKLLVYTAKGVEHSTKIASYDFDWTIVGTSSGRVYPRDKDDWCILLPEIPGQLKKLKSEGYKLVIFSNQSGISTGKVKPKEFQSKIENVLSRLGVPMQVFVATGTSFYRKPCLGMWETLVEQFNGGISVNMEESHYCGDAAGRPVDWAPKKKKDFSCSDRLYAMNIGIKFYTPEEHFQNARKAPFVLPDFRPMSLPNTIPEFTPTTSKLLSDNNELVIMVGCPGSGKSFFAKKYLVAAGYKYVNMDELKSASKCIDAAKSGLQAGLSVVVDNTNPDKQSRARFIKEAKRVGITCRCFLMATTAIHARHNIRFRELTDPSHTKIPEMIVRTYEKNFQEPELDEGFKEILKVNFIPHFSDFKLKSLYEKYLI